MAAYRVWQCSVDLTVSDSLSIERSGPLLPSHSIQIGVGKVRPVCDGMLTDSHKCSQRGLAMISRLSCAKLSLFQKGNSDQPLPGCLRA